ncbi:MAG TPA: UDP-glucuronic acid decarboxylase family protein [Chloroflexia bacterium]|nr:UDP-glucuronic acid decarboxylase family protein [Chloroflexia bacterium]
MRVVVTGGAGFIGSHLCEALLAEGHEVTAVDNFLTGSRANIAHLEGEPRFSLVEHDITMPFGGEVEARLGKVDALFHLASPASPADFSKIPLEIAIINSQGTHNVLELARRHGAKYLLTSTSEAYGDPLVHPQTEDYRGNVSTTGLRACYDEGKRFAEAITSVYVREYGVDGRIVRIFNTYGPRMNPEDGRSVPNFITQALRGKPLTVYGEGKQTRSYCYVSDMVAGLMAVMAAPAEKAKGVIFNVGNPDEREILAFAQIIRELCGSDSPIEYQVMPQDDPVRRCPDITRIKTRLGWEPRVPLEEGLPKTIEWFRSVIGDM